MSVDKNIELAKKCYDNTRKETNDFAAQDCRIGFGFRIDPGSWDEKTAEVVEKRINEEVVDKSIHQVQVQHTAPEDGALYFHATFVKHDQVAARVQAVH